MTLTEFEQGFTEAHRERESGNFEEAGRILRAIEQKWISANGPDLPYHKITIDRRQTP
jgi:hypothetical protein